MGNDSVGFKVVVLLLTIVAGVIFWPRGSSFHHSRIYHAHEHFHYTLTTRYLDELGYFNLYPAVMQARVENGHSIDFPPQVRNQITYEQESSKAIGPVRAEAKARFSPARWSAFRKDVADFDRVSNRAEWKKFVTDKGFNASPAWALVASCFSTRVEITREGLTALACIDFVLLIAALIAIWRTFGLPATAFFAVAFAFSPLSTYGFVGGSLLRQDWLVASVFGACFVRLKSFATAGFFLAYAALMRGFPAAFFIPVVLSCAVDLLRHRKLFKRYGRFLAGAVACCILLVGASSLRYGAGIWPEWLRKVKIHTADIGSRRVGLEYAAIYEGERTDADFRRIKDAAGGRWKEHKKEVRSDRSPLILLIQATAIGALAALLWFRRVPFLVQLGLGSLLVPIFMAPSDYYYSFLALTGVCMWPVMGRRDGILIGCALMFIIPLTFQSDKAGLIAEFRQFVVSAYLSGLVFVIPCLIYPLLSPRAVGRRVPRVGMATVASTSEVRS